MISVLKKKLSKKGFTLAELLVVVAIIGVLVAIAIPVFSSATEKAKQAADLANIRGWYAEVVVDYLSDNTALPDAASDYDGPTLNYSSNLTVSYTAPTSSADGKWKISYTGSKLNPTTWTSEEIVIPKTA